MGRRSTNALMSLRIKGSSRVADEVAIADMHFDDLPLNAPHEETTLDRVRKLEDEVLELSARPCVTDFAQTLEDGHADYRESMRKIGMDLGNAADRSRGLPDRVAVSGIRMEELGERVSSLEAGILEAR